HHGAWRRRGYALVGLLAPKRDCYLHPRRQEHPGTGHPLRLDNPPDRHQPSAFRWAR
ncbi:unnamed protein product, partial [Phaeothamnion confervicola]